MGTNQTKKKKIIPYSLALAFTHTLGTLTFLFVLSFIFLFVFGILSFAVIHNPDLSFGGELFFLFGLAFVLLYFLNAGKIRKMSDTVYNVAGKNTWKDFPSAMIVCDLQKNRVSGEPEYQKEWVQQIQNSWQPGRTVYFLWESVVRFRLLFLISGMAFLMFILFIIEYPILSFMENRPAPPVCHYTVQFSASNTLHWDAVCSHGERPVYWQIQDSSGKTARRPEAVLAVDSIAARPIFRVGWYRVALPWKKVTADVENVPAIKLKIFQNGKWTEESGDNTILSIGSHYRFEFSSGPGVTIRELYSGKRVPEQNGLFQQEFVFRGPEEKRKFEYILEVDSLSRKYYSPEYSFFSNLPPQIVAEWLTENEIVMPEHGIVHLPYRVYSEGTIKRLRVLVEGKQFAVPFPQGGRQMEGVYSYFFSGKKSVTLILLAESENASLRSKPVTLRLGDKTSSNSEWIKQAVQKSANIIQAAESLEDSLASAVRSGDREALSAAVQSQKDLLQSLRLLSKETGYAVNKEKNLTEALLSEAAARMESILEQEIETREKEISDLLKQMPGSFRERNEKAMQVSRSEYLEMLKDSLEILQMAKQLARVQEISQELQKLRNQIASNSLTEKEIKKFMELQKSAEANQTPLAQQASQKFMEAAEHTAGKKRDAMAVESLDEAMAQLNSEMQGMAQRMQSENTEALKKLSYVVHEHARVFRTLRDDKSSRTEFLEASKKLAAIYSAAVQEQLTSPFTPSQIRSETAEVNRLFEQLNNSAGTPYRAVAVSDQLLWKLNTLSVHLLDASGNGSSSMVLPSGSGGDQNLKGEQKQNGEGEAAGISEDAKKPPEGNGGNSDGALDKFLRKEEGTEREENNRRKETQAREFFPLSRKTERTEFVPRPEYDVSELTAPEKLFYEKFFYHYFRNQSSKKER